MLKLPWYQVKKTKYTHLITDQLWYLRTTWFVYRASSGYCDKTCSSLSCRSLNWASFVLNQLWKWCTHSSEKKLFSWAVQFTEWAFKVVHLNLLKCSMKKLKIVCSWYLSLISCLKTINCHIDNAWIRTGVLWRQMRPLLQLCHSKCLQQHRQQLAIVLSQQKITPHKVITCS